MALKQDWNQGGGALPPRGGERPSLRDILNPITGLTLAQAKALPPDERFHGMRAIIDGGRYVFDEENELDGDDVLVIEPTSGDGRFVADVGAMVDMRLPFTFATTDGATLYEIPGDLTSIMVLRCYWEVTTAFSGGSSSAIGASSSEAGLTTKGDLHGAAAGTTATDLNVTPSPPFDALYPSGAPGTDLGAGPVFLSAGSTVKLDRITSAFTAGAGALHVVGIVVRSPA